MQKLALLVLLVPLVFGLVHDLSYLGEEVSWSVQDEILTIRWVGQLEENTWFSLGLQSNGVFDAWTIYRNEAECYKGCLVDAKYKDDMFTVDGESSLFGQSIDISGNSIGVQFSRKLNSADSEDIEITPGTEQLFFWTDRKSFTAIRDIDIASNIANRKRIDFGDDEPAHKRDDTYTFKIASGDFLFEWAIDGDRIVGRMSAPVTGWISVGFAKDAGMPDTDTIMASVNGANVQIRDSYATGNAQPPADVSRGGTNDAEVRGSSEVNGKTTVAFRRKLNTGDRNDRIISNQNQFINFAYAKSDNLANIHDVRGTFQANLITGAGANGGVAPAGGVGGGVTGLRTGQFVLLVVFLVAAAWLVLRMLHKLVKKIRRRAKANRAYKDTTPASFDSLVLSQKKSIIPHFIHKCLHVRIPKTHLNVEFLLIWTFFMAVNIVAVFIDERGRVLKKWANVMGSLVIANLLLVSIPATRNSLIVLLWGIPFDRTIQFHRWQGRFTFMISTIHAIMEIKRFGFVAIIGTIVDRFAIVSWASMLIMIITSIGPIRRKVYTVFKMFHFTYLLVYIFAFLHEEECRPYVIAVALILLFDKLFRIIWGTLPVKALVATTKQKEVVHIKFRKHCLAQRLRLHRVGQYIFVNFPSVNLFEWHPFSVSSGPDEDTVEIHVKPLGRFTKKLMSVVSQQPQHLWMRTEGPYGNLKFNYRRYDKLVLVAGGIGVTPIISMLKDIYRYGTLASNAPQTHKMIIKDVIFVWAIRNVEQYEWFKQEIEFFWSKTGVPGFPLLDLKIYVSQGKPEYPFFAGRPDVKGCVGQVASSLENHQSMMAFVCGPEMMVNDTWDACTEWKGKGTHIKFHKETFCF